MQRSIFLIILLFSANILVLSQNPVLKNDSTDNKKGKPIIQVFGNFDYNLTEGIDKHYGFWIGRAHLGYEYQFSDKLSGKLIIDRGSPTNINQINFTDSLGQIYIADFDVSNGSYYTMTLKFASLEWKFNDKFKIQAGGILQNHFIVQERFWGYRYVLPTFQDRYYHIPSGDLGFIAYYSPIKIINIDFAITNGEGFRFNQDAFGGVEIAGGIDINLIKGLQTRFFYSYNISNNPATPDDIQLISTFAGYKFRNKFRIGAEYNYRKNHLNQNNRDLYGYSVFGSYTILSGIDIFARFDNIESNRYTGCSDYYDFINIGKAYLVGIHHSPLNGVNISLNYQAWQPKRSNIDFRHKILLSFEFKY